MKNAILNGSGWNWVWVSGLMVLSVSSVWAGSTKEGENDQVGCTQVCDLPVSYMKSKDDGFRSGPKVVPEGTAADTVDNG